MLDQAERLRELARTSRRRGRVVAVTSGKGGVGKTNLAVNLAVASAAAGRRVTLLDVDLGLANVDILMNLSPRYTLAHVLSGGRSLAEIVTPGPGGVRVVPGASGVPGLADLDQAGREGLLHELGELEESTDLLVLDTGAGISRNVMAFAAAADEVVVVTTPEPTSVLDAFATIKVLSREDALGRIRLVVNQCATRAEADAVSRRVAGACRQFLGLGVDRMGYIMTDYHVGEAVRMRRPLVLAYPDAPASRCIRTLAGLLAGAPSTPRPAGFFRRVVDRLASEARR